MRCCSPRPREAADAVLVLRTGVADTPAITAPGRYVRERFVSEAARRGAFASPLERAASAYVVPRGRGKTIVAGYPWFTDWGRDTFIALRGFMTLPGGVDFAREILVAWTDVLSEGMLPNCFPDAGEQPRFSGVDASLWYVVAVYDYLRATPGGARSATAGKPILLEAAGRILESYRAGTRFGIRMQDDGLIAAGRPGKVAGLGHVSEVADAELPHRPGGCPFQAWSLGEFVRASRLVDQAPAHEPGRPPSRRIDAAV